MSIAQYSVSWDSYKTTVCNGFTNFQQNEEFVDMTLAADGHLVRVHKSIFALASPYIKSMLQCTPNEHPVVFLSNVSHEILNYILTYIYTGEVSVGVDKIQSFMRVAKDLRLSGLFGMPTPKVGSRENVKSFHNNDEEQTFEVNDIPNTENPFGETVTDNAVLIDRVCVTAPTLTNVDVLNTTVSSNHINEPIVKNINVKYNTSNDINLQEEPDNKSDEGTLNRKSGLYMTADGYPYKLEIQQAHNKLSDCTPAIVDDTFNKTCELIQASSSKNNAVISINYNSYDFDSEDKNNTLKSEAPTAPLLPVGPLDPKDFTPQYSVSNRGCLQLILNRYLYYCHHQSHGGRKRRWRCIDYRSKHCPAFIDTDNEVMTSRKFGHVHSFHDEKIRKKMKRDLVFTNLSILQERQKNRKISSD